MVYQEFMDSYAYVLVKIAGAKTRTFTKEHLLELVKCQTVDEFKERLLKIGKDIPAELIESSKDLEKTLKELLFSLIRELLKNAPKECQEFLIAYISKYEMENLKNIFIGKLLKVAAAEIEDRIFFEIEELMHTRKIIREALRVDDISKVIYLYRNTPYHHTLHEIENRFEKTGEVFYVHAYLDKHYIDTLHDEPRRGIKWSKNQKKIVEFFVGTITDQYNITVVVRGSFNGFSWEQTELFLANESSCYKVHYKDLKAIHEMGRDTGKIANYLKQLFLGYEDGKHHVGLLKDVPLLHSVRNFYYNLQISFLKKIQFEAGYRFGTVILFIIRKENEINNLATIYEGIKNDYDREKLKDYLILEA